MVTSTHFGTGKPEPLTDIAGPLAQAARDVASGFPMPDSMLGQTSLSVAMQALINAVSRHGDLDHDGIVGAFASAFGSYVAQQTPDRQIQRAFVTDLRDGVTAAIETVHACRRAGRQA